MAQLTRTSRFRRTSLVKTRTGLETYGLVSGFNNIKFIKDINVRYETIDNTESGRPDLIADRVYGNSHLEWILVFANRPKNPLNWPVAGEVIKIPTNEFVKGIF